MHREKNLRMPLAVEKAREVAALCEIHHERVAVDVVSCVLVIRPRQRPALERRPLVLVVPVDHETMPVGVEHRDDDEHHVAQLFEDFGIVRRRKLVEKMVRGLRGADFGGVNAAADGDHDLVVRRDAVRILGPEGTRVREPLVVALDLIEVADVLGRRHDGGDRAVVLGRGSEVGDLDTIGSRRHELEVLLDGIR